MNNAELWARLTELPRAHCVVDFPRKNDKGEPFARVAIWVLTQEEQMAANASAERVVRSVLKDVPRADEARRGYDNLFDNAGAVEILFRACRQAEQLTSGFFPTLEHVKKLTVDEIAVLMSHYLSTQAELGPIASSMTKEEMDSWIDRLVESGERFPLDLLSPELLKTLALSMASRLRVSRTGTSSPGSPPENVSAPSESECPPA